MTRIRYLVLIAGLIATTQIAQAQRVPTAHRSVPHDGAATSTPAVPTVAVPAATRIPVPTVDIPRPTPVRHRHPKHPNHRNQATVPPVQWIWAFLTSYCPGTAGWISASGEEVFYGMLANDYYSFGTRVRLPVLGITGVVEDRFGGYRPSNDFDVWSPVCYSTPTGWYRVGVLQ